MTVMLHQSVTVVGALDVRSAAHGVVTGAEPLVDGNNDTCFRICVLLNRKK